MPRDTKHRITLTVRIEDTDQPALLAHWLNQAIEKQCRDANATCDIAMRIESIAPEPDVFPEMERKRVRDDVLRGEEGEGDDD